MKKLLLIFGLFLFCAVKANAEIVEFNVNMQNFWNKNGIYEQKVLDVGTKLINANKLNKRVVLRVVRNIKIVNADASYSSKIVRVYTGILPYVDNDDELAFLIGHESAHCLDFYDGFLKYISFKLNSKEYETKADLIGIDLMVKAGYNPVAAITVMNKVSDESIWDTWIFMGHPKGSTRLVNMYKYIYKKYPWALNTDMVHNINYQNFTYSSQKEINKFKQDEKFRADKKEVNL